MPRPAMVLPANPHWLERLLRSTADPRVVDWPMMSTPAWPLTVCAVYLYFVLSYGPRLMKVRPAYSFKSFMTFYNVYQVVANSAMFYVVLTSGWTTSYTLGCQPVDRSNSPEAMRMANAMWWWFVMKKSELIETALFVLRKKTRQISFLHIYHHISTYLIAWTACEFVPGGMSTFTVLPNSLVHVCMYSYYLLSTIDNPTLQKSLASFKKYITTLQMVQLTIIVLHSLQSLMPSCNVVPKPLAYSFVPNVLLVIYLFYDFYRSNYRSGSGKALVPGTSGATSAPSARPVPLSATVPEVSAVPAVPALRLRQPQPLGAEDAANQRH